MCFRNHGSSIPGDGRRCPKIWSGKYTTGISMSAKIFSLLCEFCVCDIMLLPFPSRSEAYAIKLGHSQVMDFLRHSGSDRPLNFAMDQLLNIWLDYEIASEVVDKLTLF